MSATTTGMLAINAAFLQEIKEDHQQLHKLLDESSRSLSGSLSRGTLRRVVGLLAELEDCLAMHFVLEEAYGYCQDAISVAPWLSAHAETLRGEHEPLFRALQEIVDEAEQMLYGEAPLGRTRRLADRFRRFRAELDEHERREGELILAAFDDDVGVGD